MATLHLSISLHFSFFRAENTLQFLRFACKVRAADAEAFLDDLEEKQSQAGKKRRRMGSIDPDLHIAKEDVAAEGGTHSASSFSRRVHLDIFVHQQVALGCSCGTRFCGLQLHEVAFHEVVPLLRMCRSFRCVCVLSTCVVILQTPEVNRGFGLN
jgi:hypothetical protein